MRPLPICDEDALEKLFLDDPCGRQLLHLKRRSVRADTGLHPCLISTLRDRTELYQKLLAVCLERHFLPDAGS